MIGNPPKKQKNNHLLNPHSLTHIFPTQITVKNTKYLYLRVSIDAHTAIAALSHTRK